MGAVCLGTLLSAQFSHEPNTTGGGGSPHKESLRAVVEPQSESNSGSGDLASRR